MKILVTYFTQTGNTEKVARAIHDELSADHVVDLLPIGSTGPDTTGAYDLVFVGSPCHAGDISAQAKGFLTGLPQGGTFGLAGFITHASSAWERAGFEKCITTFETTGTAKEIRFLGCFDCQGYLSPDIQPYVKKARKASDEEWNAIIQKMTGHPDTEDENNARRFARSVVSGR